MGEFTQVLTEGLRDGNISLVIILMVFFVVLNAHKLYPLLVERKRHRLKGVEAALQSEYVQGLERACLKEQAATEHFYAATGIMMEKAPREALLRIYEGSGGRLPFVHFKRAVFHVGYEKGMLKIKLGHVEWLMMWVGLITGLPLFAVSCEVLLWTLYMLLILGSEPVGSWNTWLVSSLTGWALVMSCRSAYSANCIRKEIDRQAKAESAPEGPADEPTSTNV